MKTLVVLAHPNRGSFNHAIAETAIQALNINGHDVTFHDLYREGFNPELPYDEILEDEKIPGEIKKYCSELAEAEGIIVVHPNWWGQPPAILKGYIDRIFRPGVAYRFEEGDGGEGVPRGLLKAKAAVVFNTSNTASSREMEVFGDPLEKLWKNCIFDLCGVKTFYRRMFGVIVTSTAEQRGAWLNEVQEIVKRYFPAG
ncbi:MAG: NAD(P)H-dependent oxidoreductase [Dehalococcoidia bacterium]